MTLLAQLKHRTVAILILLFFLTGQARAYDASSSIGALLPDHSLPWFFVETFDDLMSRHWNEDGNWEEDVQNDATAFAPELLFALDATIRKDSGEGPGEFYRRAYQTGIWEKNLLKDAVSRFLQGGISDGEIFDTAVGTYSFLACAQFGLPADAGYCRSIMKPIIKVANFFFLSPLFQWLGVFEGQEATLYSRLIFINLEYYKAFGQISYRDAAEKLARKLDRLANAEQGGLFEGNVFGWSQASPLVAYASLYQATLNETYLEKANRLIAALDRGYLFGKPDQTEAYWEFKHNELESNEEYWVLASSTHVQFLEAFTILAIATEDPYYLERANRFLEFAVQYLYIPYHGDSDTPHFAHDLSWPVNQSYPAYDEIQYNDWYCSGESFNFLRIAWKLLEFQRG